MPRDETEIPLTENLTIKSVGYLKAPEAFKNQFPNWLNAPTPTATLKIANGKAILSYAWRESDLKNAKPIEVKQ